MDGKKSGKENGYRESGDVYDILRLKKKFHMAKGEVHGMAR